MLGGAPKLLKWWPDVSCQSQERRSCPPCSWGRRGAWEQQYHNNRGWPILHCFVQNYITTHCITPDNTTPRYTRLHYTRVYYTTLHLSILYYTTLEYTILHHTSPHYPVWHRNRYMAVRANQNNGGDESFPVSKLQKWDTLFRKLHYGILRQECSLFSF